MSWKGDPNAIHLVVDGEIDGLTEKASPVDADLIIIEDSAASNTKKKAQLGNLPGGGTSLTTKGDLHGFSTVDARIPVGSDDQVLTADSAQALGVKWATPSGGGSSGALLATNIYDPGTIAIYGTSSATMAEADTTNLRMSFSAPASGTVIGVLTAVASASSSSVAAQEWGIMDGGVVLPESRGRIATIGNTIQVRITHRFVVTGLSGSQTWDWAFARDSGTNDARFFAGGITGQAVMEAWAA